MGFFSFNFYSLCYAGGMKFLIFFLLVVFGMPVVNAQVVSGPNMGQDYILYENAVVPLDMNLNSGIVIVKNNNIMLENLGIIDADFVLSSADLFIKNSGQFRADFYLYNHSNVFQVISDAENYNLIDFNVDYGLVIQDLEKELSISDVLDFTLGAKSVLIENAILNLNNVSLSDLRHIDLTLNGVVIFKIDDVLALDKDGVLFDNVDGSAQIYLAYNNENTLFTKIAYMDAGKLVITEERETDYVKILDDNTGQFLNDLRLAGKKDVLLSRLDSAKSVEDIYTTLNESVIFNADKLFYPIKNVISMNKNDFISSGIGGGGFAMVGDDYYAYGLNFDFVGDTSERLLLYLGGQIAMLDYQSDIDTYSATQYSAEIGAEFKPVSNILFDVSVGVGLANFDVGNVLFDNKLFNNPSLLSVYSVFDFGYRFDFDNHFSLMPFLGTEFNMYDSDAYSEKYIAVRGGVELMYTHKMLGLRYDYGVKIVANQKDEFVASAMGRFWSDNDFIGGNIELSAIQLQGNISCNVSVGVNLRF